MSTYRETRRSLLRRAIPCSFNRHRPDREKVDYDSTVHSGTCCDCEAPHSRGARTSDAAFKE